MCAQSCLTLCDPMDYSPPGLCPWNFPGKNTGVSCHSCSRGSSQSRDSTCVSCISCTGRQILSHCATWGTPYIYRWNYCTTWASLVAQMVENPPAPWETWLGRSPGGGHGNTLLYSCLENPHGQRSLAGYSPWDHRVGHHWATKHITWSLYV